MIDIAIHETLDGGDLSLMNNDIATVSGLTNQIYIALFGGNLDQKKEWWGNELDLSFNSKFEAGLQKHALNSSGVLALEALAQNDLACLKEFGTLAVEASLIAPNKMELKVQLSQTVASIVWDGTKNTIIYDNSNI